MSNNTTPAAAQSRDFNEAQCTSQSAAPPLKSERKAFVFYSNWYDDTLQSLSREEQGEFLLTVVHYAVRGELPSDACNPVIRTMFGLIRPAIDADLQKYDRIVENNRKRADMNHERCVENQRTDHKKPIINNQESIISNQESSSIEEKKEEEALARFADVEVYWQQRGFKSSAREFYDFYELRQWVGRRGERISSWKKAACMWEDKFRRDVLPVRRREQMAEARERRELQAAENRRIREAEREAREAEDAQRGAHAVTREQGRYMYDRALRLSDGDDAAAMALLERSSRDPAIFRLLLEGFPL